MKSFKTVSESTEHMPHEFLKTRTKRLLEEHGGHQELDKQIDHPNYTGHSFHAYRDQDDGDGEDDPDEMYGTNFVQHREHIKPNLEALGWKHDPLRSAGDFGDVNSDASYHFSVEHWSHPNGLHLQHTVHGSADDAGNRGETSNWVLKKPK